MRAGWLAMLALGCQGYVVPTDEPIEGPDRWLAETVGNFEQASPVRIGARPDGRMWITAGSAFAWENDIECAHGYDGGTFTYAFVGTIDAWTPTTSLRTSDYGVWPDDRVAVAAHPTTGDLVFAWPTGPGNGEYCGPSDLTVGASQLTDPWVRGDLTPDGDGYVELAGFWPAVVVREDGHTSALYQRHRATADERTTELWTMQTGGTPERVSDADGLGRFPAMMYDASDPLEPVILAADLNNLFALTRQAGVWTPERIALTPLAHPDLLLREDGTVVAVMVEGSTGNAIRLERGETWTSIPLNLPVRSPRRVAVEELEGRLVYVWAADGEVQLAIEDGQGGLTHQVLPNWHGHTCTDADLAVIDGVAHVISYCHDTSGRGPNLFHLWKPLSGGTP